MVKNTTLPVLNQWPLRSVLMQFLVSKNKYCMKFYGTFSFPHHGRLVQNQHEPKKRWRRNNIPMERLESEHGNLADNNHSDVGQFGTAERLIWTGLHFSVFRWRSRQFGKHFGNSTPVKIVRCRRLTIRFFCFSPWTKQIKTKYRVNRWNVTSSTRWPLQHNNIYIITHDFLSLKPVFPQRHGKVTEPIWFAVHECSAVSCQYNSPPPDDIIT